MFVDGFQGANRFIYIRLFCVYSLLVNTPVIFDKAAGLLLNSRLVGAEKDNLRYRVLIAIRWSGEQPLRSFSQSFIAILAFHVSLH